MIICDTNISQRKADIFEGKISLIYCRGSHLFLSCSMSKYKLLLIILCKCIDADYIIVFTLNEQISFQREIRAGIALG